MIQFPLPPSLRAMVGNDPRRILVHYSGTYITRGDIDDPMDYFLTDDTGEDVHEDDGVELLELHLDADAKYFKTHQRPTVLTLKVLEIDGDCGVWHVWRYVGMKLTEDSDDGEYSKYQFNHAWKRGKTVESFVDGNWKTKQDV